MKTVRRLYFYAVAFISLEVVLWGLISLLRSIFNPKLVTNSAEALAQALALILVGVPIFLVHWLWAQRASARDEEEKTSSLRAVFLYGAQLGTLIPVVQNALALLNRLLLGAVKLSGERAMIGGEQTLSDNLIAILMNLIIAAYFWNVLRFEWIALPEQTNFKDVRRLYRYLWLVYSLLMVIFGSQQVLRYIFYVPTQTIGVIGRETLVNGIALLVIGTPIWVFVWRACQSARQDPMENESLLRLGVLYLLALSGVITVLATGGNLFYTIINRLLGDPISAPDLVQKLGGQLSLIIPFGAIWAYYGTCLTRQIAAEEQPVQRAGKRRVYYYILSAIGLATSIIGVGLLISLIIDLALGLEPIGGQVFRQNLSAAIAVLVVGLPLWLSTWRPMQAEALQAGDTGDHARRSIIRKTYLYFAMFAGVIGGMGGAVGVVFELLQALLGGEVDSQFLYEVLNALQYMSLFVLVLLYHLLALRRDGFSTASALTARQAEFPILIFDTNGQFGAGMQAALARQAPEIPVTIVQTSEHISRDVKAAAVILPGSLAIQPPASLDSWLRGYDGRRLIVPDETAGVTWTNDRHQAAQITRTLAEGGQLRTQMKRGVSAWMIVIYVFAGLFGLEVLFFLLALLIPTVID